MSQENSQVFQKNSQNWQKNNDNRTFFIKVPKFQLYYKRTPSWVFFCKVFERCFLKNISGRLHLFSPSIQVLIFYMHFVISLKEFNIMSVCSCYITSITCLKSRSNSTLHRANSRAWQQWCNFFRKKNVQKIHKNIIKLGKSFTIFHKRALSCMRYHARVPPKPLYALDVNNRGVAWNIETRILGPLYYFKTELLFLSYSPPH